MIIYRASSLYSFFQSVILRFICVGCMIYLVFNYGENPTVIIIAEVLCLLFLVLLGSDTITVYSDKIIQSSNSILSLFLKNREYEIKDIKAASLEVRPPSTPGETGVALIIAAMMNSIGRRRRLSNDPYPILIELKNGKTIQLLTNFDLDKRKAIVEAINSQAR